MHSLDGGVRLQLLSVIRISYLLLLCKLLSYGATVFLGYFLIHCSDALRWAYKIYHFSTT